MDRKSILTKLLALTGTILVWFPILAPVLLSFIFLLQKGIFHIDYLMPAELFLSFLLGSALLLWAALRAHSHWKLIAWGSGVAVLMLFGGMWLAQVTGLASGATEPAGLAWLAVLASLAFYVLGILFVGVESTRLLHDLFRNPSAT